MKEFIIEENEAGQRFDKYLAKLLREAPKSFFYKMLRKKNITLNGKKATGNEKLLKGDTIKLFLSDETFDKFAGSSQAARAYCELDIVYEDPDIIIINKPAGMLSQPADDGEPSLVEYLIGYLLKKGDLTEEQLKTFRPSVCNRLDRNTSGMVCAGKSLAGLQFLSGIFHDRTLHKYYICLTKGKIEKPDHIRGYLHKDKKTNKVIVSRQEFKDSLPIETKYRPLGSNGKITLLEVELITGRTHQIRVHMNYIGHPLFNDERYGGSEIRKGTIYAKYKQFIRNCFELCPRQALHAKTLGFVHPRTREFIRFDSALPADMSALISKWRDYAGNMPDEED